jgi:hypothetical protein
MTSMRPTADAYLSNHFTAVLISISLQSSQCCRGHFSRTITNKAEVSHQAGCEISSVDGFLHFAGDIDGQALRPACMERRVCLTRFKIVHQQQLSWSLHRRQRAQTR